MSGKLPRLFHVLTRISQRRSPRNVEHQNLKQLQPVAQAWLGPARAKVSSEELGDAIRAALEDDEAALRVLGSLSALERGVIAVFRRYGDTVNGEVLRLDLLSRGLLEVAEHRVHHHTARRWKQNLIRDLAGKWVLLRDLPHQEYGYSYSDFEEADRGFPCYCLHAGIAKDAEAAGPPPWSIPPAPALPQAIVRRLPAEIVLDLSRVFDFVAARGPIKLRARGDLYVPTVRALEKSIPWAQDPDFYLPEPHVFVFELLCKLGLVRIDGFGAHADPGAAAELWGLPDVCQAHAWTRAWLASRFWADGVGGCTYEPWATDDDRVYRDRQVLAWALGCLAHAGDHWYDLSAFVRGLHAIQGHRGPAHSYGTSWAWDPAFDDANPTEPMQTADRLRAWWFASEAGWYANALMITLVALGLVERGRLGPGASAPLGFRLTTLGRAVFGAPEIDPPLDRTDRPFLRIQPNYDIVAYLDQAGAAATGLLARIAESDALRAGPVQTFRLTQASLYRGQEGGLTQAEIVDFLGRYSLSPPPANVLRSIADWAQRRERLTLHLGVTVLAFPDPLQRDAYLQGNAGAPCGERFVLADRTNVKAPSAHTLSCSHIVERRRTIELDEHGRLTSDAPVDLVQAARLGRIATKTPFGWQFSGASVRIAIAAGLKPGTIHQWLNDHLNRPGPALIQLAFDGWIGKGHPVQLGDAILLHVPNTEQFRAILASRRLRPFLEGAPGAGWLAVRPESRADLAAALEELGFKVGLQLIHNLPPEPTGAKAKLPWD